jgi:hypothetical protein
MYIDYIHITGIIMTTPVNIPENSKKRKLKLCILDWDDTLLCSSAMRPFLASEPSAEMAAALAVLDHYVIAMFEAMVNAGYKLHIVTNAEEGWVEMSSSKYLPSVSMYLILYNIPIRSANTMYSKLYPGDQVIWKWSAFISLIMDAMNMPYKLARRFAEYDPVGPPAGHQKTELKLECKTQEAKQNDHLSWSGDRKSDNMYNALLDDDIFDMDDDSFLRTVNGQNNNSIWRAADGFDSVHTEQALQPCASGSPPGLPASCPTGLLLGSPSSEVQSQPWSSDMLMKSLHEFERRELAGIEILSVGDSIVEKKAANDLIVNYVFNTPITVKVVKLTENPPASVMIRQIKYLAENMHMVAAIPKHIDIFLVNQPAETKSEIPAPSAPVLID